MNSLNFFLYALSGFIVFFILSCFKMFLYAKKKYNPKTGDTSWLITASASGELELTPIFSGFRVTQSIVFFVVFCRSLFVFLTLLWSLFSFLRFTTCVIVMLQGFKPPKLLTASPGGR